MEEESHQQQPKTKKNYKKKFKKGYFEANKSHLMSKDYLNQLQDFRTNASSSSSNPEQKKKTQQQKLVKAEKLEKQHQKLAQNVTPNESEPIGYVTIMTNFGKLNFELYCKQYPVICSRFLTCCRNFAQNFLKCEISGTQGIKFSHDQPIEGIEFMEGLLKKEKGILYAIQITSPSEGDEGEEEQEIQSQFCIPFASSGASVFSSENIQSLTSQKYVVFGRVVGGLKNLEKMQTSKADSFTITDVTIFVDPFA